MRLLTVCANCDLGLGGRDRDRAEQAKDRVEGAGSRPGSVRPQGA